MFFCVSACISTSISATPMHTTRLNKIHPFCMFSLYPKSDLFITKHLPGSPCLSKHYGEAGHTHTLKLTL